MRLVKAVLAGFLILALGVMWVNRALVVDAYRADEPVASVRLSGVDLAFQPTAIEPTPYRVPLAPDARAGAAAIGFEPGHRLPAPPPSLTGGDATLEGLITGPDGPVAGAVVLVERHTDHGAISVEVLTDDEGEWALTSLAGGRYRVRAWLPEVLTMGRSEVRFVGDDEVASFEFALWGIDPSPAFEFVDGGPMYQGVPATVAVVLGWRSIDADGLVVTNPFRGAPVTVETTAQVEVLSAQPLLTGSDGVATVLLRCVPTAVAPLEVPADLGPAGAATDVALALRSQAPIQGPTQGGSLTARSGDTAAIFALPGCLPTPQIEPGPDPQAGEAHAADPSDPSDSDGPSDPGDPTDPTGGAGEVDAVEAGEQTDA